MDNDVYLGIWTNWSKGRVMGATLTTTRINGNLLIALTGFLVPFVACRFWAIFCLVFHQCFSTSSSRNALHHQRQVILRNNSSPDSGLISILCLLWAWRNSKLSEETKKHYIRLFPLVLFSICCISAFTVAGAFSSQISSAPGDEVLLKGGQCGISYIPNSATASTTKPFSVLSEKLNDATNYAQQCYSKNSSGILDCDRFVVQKLPTAISNNKSSCPFKGALCRNNETNLNLDTGFIDSNDGLGLNARGSGRFAWRYALQCAPLVTEGYTSQVKLGNTNWTRYNYGGLTANALYNSTAFNFTYEIEDLSSQYYMLGDAHGAGTLAGMNYRLSSMRSSMFNGTVDASQSAFKPIPQLTRTDGDVSVLFLSGNGVFFNGPMDDDWYRGTVFGKNLSHMGNQANQGVIQGYVPSEAASPLGCVEQWQWCNSTYPKDTGCGPLAGILDSIYGAAPFFNITADDLAPDRPSSPTEIGTRLLWPAMIQLFGASNIPELLNQLGAKSLASQSLLTSGLQAPLPRNQWQLDVSNWFNTVLASVQAMYVSTALGTTDQDLKSSEYPPLNSHERNFCNNQKVRSSTYTSFSLFGLFFTYATGIIITLVSYIIEPILGCLHKRCRYNEYSYLEWTTNGTLQLHRLAQEELKLGTWSGCSDRVPITNGNDIMACLDISHPDHPVLACPTMMVKQESRTDSSFQDSKSRLSDDSRKTIQSEINVHSSNENDQKHGTGWQHVPVQEDVELLVAVEDHREDTPSTTQNQVPRGT